MLENGLHRYHALLAAHATPTNPVYTQYVQRLAVLAASRGGDPVAAQRQAAVLANNVINGQASVLAFDHAFQIVVIAVLAMIVCVPFFRVPSGARGAPMH
jgi:hypothetical protein